MPTDDGSRRRFLLKYLPLAILAALALAGLLMFGPPKLLARTETPEFCASCHVMEAEYEAWFHTGAHRRIRCVDCHLPHQNPAVYYMWKGIDGTRDAVMFHTGLVPDRIEISRHGQDVLQDNCLRCHAEAVAMIDKERRCWGCHRRLAHRTSGAMIPEPREF